MAEKEDIFPNLNNGALVDAMNALKKSENPKTQNKFVSEAVKAKYFAPVDLLDADGNLIDKTGKVELPKDAKFNFKLIRNMEGQDYFLLFTDIAEFQKWSKEEKVKTIVVDFPHMANLTIQHKEKVSGMVINPLGHNLIFRSEVLEDMAKQLREAQEAKGIRPAEKREIKLMLGKPVNIPDSVLESFRKTLAKNEGVNAVYFLMMKQGEQENYLFVFDTELENAEAKKIADSFSASARLFLTKYPIVTAPLKSPVGENAPNVTEPFYKKA